MHARFIAPVELFHVLSPQRFGFTNVYLNIAGWFSWFYRIEFLYESLHSSMRIQYSEIGLQKCP